MTQATAPLLEMRNITKRFPGVLAVDNVSFEVMPGEVHALVGENGAGKSTLMKILSGVYQPDGGEIIFNGQPVTFNNPRQAQSAGITTIHQELNQIPMLSVTENIFLGSEIMRGPFINWGEMHRQAREQLAKLRLEVNPRVWVGTLGVGKQQMVEVAKALHHRSDIIIMDEPTAALSLNEIEDLFGIIRELRDNGVSVVYISHHLNEAFEVCDRITVLRDGQHIATRPVAELNMDDLINLMVGRALEEQMPKAQAERGDEVLRVAGLNQAGKLKDINFSAYAGEILGVAGLVGAGRTELLRALFGADPVDSGTIYINGQQVAINNPRDAIRNGMALLTEDRKSQGLVLGLSTRENISMSVLDTLTNGPIIDRGKERVLANNYVASIDIRISDLEQLVKNLSGGNQQKVVLSKWMATEPRILMFDEPTRGIDVGAKAEIYKLMNDLVAQGVVIIMVSSELPEVLNMSDRVMVIHDGTIAGILNREAATQESIMELATGSSAAQVPEAVEQAVKID